MSGPASGEKTEIRASARHGRGLFAARALGAGELIGTYPLLVLSAAEIDALKATRLYHYVFFVDEAEPGRVRAAVAFGAISMCNHSGEANAAFAVDAAAQAVTLVASRPISAGAEILIDYEDFAEETFLG